MDNYTGKRIFLENDPVVDLYKQVTENVKEEIVNSPASIDVQIDQNREALGQTTNPEDDVNSILGSNSISNADHIDKSHGDVLRQLVGSGNFELKGVNLRGGVHQSELLHKSSGKSLYALSSIGENGETKTQVSGDHTDPVHEYPIEQPAFVTKDAADDGKHEPQHQEPDGDEAPGNPSDGDDDAKKKVEESTQEQIDNALKEKQEFYVNKLTKNLQSFKEEYGDSAESILQETAMKLAKNDLGVQ